MTGYEAPGKVKEPPEAFKQWAGDNIGRFSDPRQVPYFLRDNAKYAGLRIDNWVKPSAGNNTGFREVKNPVSDAIKKRRCEIRAMAKATIVDKAVMLPIIGKLAVISNKGVKEWLNQPHKHLAEKNELLLDIQNVLDNAIYLGYGKDIHSINAIAHIFEITLGGDSSWIIVREFYDGRLTIHSISDCASILSIIKKP